MIISRESDYAIRILRCLADGEKHNTGEMCTKEFIPKQFAYKIIEKLRKAGLVECLRGRSGGCRLSCDLHEISLYDLFLAIDNDCYVNLCLKPGYVCPWQKAHGECCKVHGKLTKMQGSLDDLLKSMDLYSVILEDG